MNPERLDSNKPIEIEGAEQEPAIYVQENHQQTSENIPESPSQNTAVNIDEIGQQEVSPVQKKEELTIIEGILAEGLSDVFENMDAQTQSVFKQTGESVSREVLTILESKKPNHKLAQNLIRDWLRIIPNVDNHFVEQEMKIKYDALLEFDQETRTKV